MLRSTRSSSQSPAHGELLRFLGEVTFDGCQPRDPPPRDWFKFPEPHPEELPLDYRITRLGEGGERMRRRLSPAAYVTRYSTFAIGALLNRSVAAMDGEHCFLNVGLWHGFSYLCGLLGNPGKRCLGVDHFQCSEPHFQELGSPREAFFGRFEKWKSSEHQVFEMDYKLCLKDHLERAIGVYFYDGDHDYESQYDALKLAEPHLAEGALVLVDDINWEEPYRATLDFVSRSSATYDLLFEARTCGNAHPTWWNGLLVLQKT